MQYFTCYDKLPNFGILNLLQCKTPSFSICAIKNYPFICAKKIRIMVCLKVLMWIENTIYAHQINLGNEIACWNC